MSDEPQIVELTADFAVEDDSTRQLGAPQPARSLNEPTADLGEDGAPRALAFADDESGTVADSTVDATSTDTTSTPGTDNSTSSSTSTTAAAASGDRTSTTTAPRPERNRPAATGPSAPATTAAPTTTTTTAAPRTAPATPTTAAPAAPAAPSNNGPAARVATNGRVNGAGFSNTPIGDALAAAQPGTVFEFAPGQHAPIRMNGLRGQAGNPIVLTAADPGNPPVFTDNNYTRTAALDLRNSSHITIANVSTRRSLWGVRLDGSTNINLDRLVVTDIGQEGIRVMNHSAHVTIQNSTVSHTGNRTGIAPDGQPFSTFGEGIYLGTGKNQSDAVRNVRILNNEISHTGTEAIDVKPPVRDVEISRNRIHDIRTGTSGAVVVHIQKDFVMASPNIRITQNTISNVTTTSQWMDGNGIAVGSSAEIVGNTIRNTQHFGIRIEDGGSIGNQITLTIRDNAISGAGNGAMYQAGGNATLLT